MNLKRKDFIFILIFFSLIITFFGTLIFTDATYYHRDVSKYYYPTKFFSTESIQNGQIPFWNPYLFCGTPFLATVQHGLFYPLSTIYYILSFNLGFKYFFIIHFFLAGLFLYLLLRKLEIDCYSSFIASSIWVFSGYLISLTNVLTSLCAVIWAPLAFLFFNVAIQRKNYFFSLLTGLILGFQFFAGQPEVVYMTILVLGFYVIFNISFIIKRNKVFSTILYEIKTILFIFILALAISFLISLVQIIPLIELMGYSWRSQGATFDTATYWSFHPLELVTLLIPSFSWNLIGIENWMRQYWLRTNFIGIWPLFLIILALLFKQKYKKERLFFFILLIFSLMVSLGKYTPLYYVLYRFLPSFKFIRYPVKFMFLVNFSLVILSGIGLQYLIGFFNVQKYLIKLLKILIIIFIICLSGLLFSYFVQTQIAEFLTRHFLFQLSSNQLTSLKTEYLPLIFREYSILVISMGVGIFFIFLLYKNKISFKSFNLLFFIIIFINLEIVNFNIEPMVKTAFYNQKGIIIKYLKGEGRFFLTPKTYEEVTKTVPIFNDQRSISLPNNENIYIHRKSLLLSNTGWRWHLFDAGGYATIQLAKYANFMNLIRTQPTPSASPALNLLGIKYLISLWDIKDPDLSFYATVNYVKIYENKNSLPRVSIIPRAIFVDDENRVSSIVKNLYFDPANEVVIETYPSEVRIQKSDGGQTEVMITRYDNNKVDIEAELGKPGWLLLTDTYYPGWKVYIDTKKDKIYKADYLFRAVYLDSGKHKVKFVYEPTLFRLAMVITVLTIVVSGFIGVKYLKCLIRKGTTNDHKLNEHHKWTRK